MYGGVMYDMYVLYIYIYYMFPSLYVIYLSSPTTYHTCIFQQIDLNYCILKLI